MWPLLGDKTVPATKAEWPLDLSHGWQIPWAAFSKSRLSQITVLILSGKSSVCRFCPRSRKLCPGNCKSFFCSAPAPKASRSFLGFPELRRHAPRASGLAADTLRGVLGKKCKVACPQTDRSRAARQRSLEEAAIIKRPLLRRLALLKRLSALIKRPLRLALIKRPIALPALDKIGSARPLINSLHVAI